MCLKAIVERIYIYWNKFKHIGVFKNDFFYFEIISIFSFCFHFGLMDVFVFATAVSSCGAPVWLPRPPPVVVSRCAYCREDPRQFLRPETLEILAIFARQRTRNLQGLGTEMGPLQNRKPSSSSIQHIPTPPLQNRKPSSSREHKHTTIIQKKPLQNHAQAK